MLGFAYYEMQEPDRALPHFEAAQAIAEEINSQQPLAEALLGLGLVQQSRGDTSAALDHYRRALAVAQPINLKPVIRVATHQIEALSEEKEE